MNKNEIEVGDKVVRTMCSFDTSNRVSGSKYQLLRVNTFIGEELVVTATVTDNPNLLVCVKVGGDVESEGIFSRNELRIVQKEAIMVAGVMEINEMMVAVVELLRIFPNNVTAVQFNGGENDELDTNLINVNVPKLRELLKNHPRFKQRERERKLNGLSIALADAEHAHNKTAERVGEVKRKLQKLRGNQSEDVTLRFEIPINDTPPTPKVYNHTFRGEMPSFSIGGFFK